MNLGIRAHDLGTFDSVEELGEAVRKEGLDSIQLVIHKALKNVRSSPGLLEDRLVEDIRKGLESAGVEVALLGAYFNWFHDSDGKGQQIFKEHLAEARAMGAGMVGTEVQGISPWPFGPNPRNQSRKAFRQALKIAVDLQETAEKANVFIGIEGAVSHALPDPETVRRLRDESGAERIRFIFDLYNFLYRGNYKRQEEIIDRALELYGNNLAIIHCKDFVPTALGLRQVAPGKGILNYDYLMRIMAEKDLMDRPFILEGVTGASIPESVRFLRETAVKFE